MFRFIAFVLVSLVAGKVIAMTDPMQPPGIQAIKSTTGKNTASKWQLTSTLIARNRRLATVNGKTLSIGESVNGAELIDIQPAKVTLRFENRSLEIRLLPSTIKRRQYRDTEYR